MDPLVYDGTFLAGKHNGGFANSFNHGSYIYCYQSPVVLVDPNGKQTAAPGTGGAWMIDRQYSSVPYYSANPATEMHNNPSARYFTASAAWGTQDSAGNINYANTTLYANSNKYSVNGKVGYMADKTHYIDVRDQTQNLVAVGAIGLPLAAMELGASAAGTALYQGASWLVRQYGVSFAQEYSKRAIDSRTWNVDMFDIGTSTILSKYKLGAFEQSAFSLIKSNIDITLDGTAKTTFGIGEKKSKTDALIDMTFDGINMGGKSKDPLFQVYNERILGQLKTEIKTTANENNAP